MQIFIRACGKTLTLDVEAETTVRYVKALIQDQDPNIGFSR